MEVIDEEINRKTSLERASEKALFKVKNFRETCKFLLPTPNPSDINLNYVTSYFNKNKDKL